MSNLDKRIKDFKDRQKDLDAPKAKVLSEDLFDLMGDNLDEQQEKCLLPDHDIVWDGNAYICLKCLDVFVGKSGIANEREKTINKVKDFADKRFGISVDDSEWEKLDA